MFANLSNKKKGIYLALITSVISGFAVFLNKYALSYVKPPLYFTSVKNLAVGLIIFWALISSDKIKEIKYLNKREWLYLLFIGLIGGAIPFYLYFEGLSQVSAINGALIHKSLVIWVTLLAVPFLHEKFTKTQALAVLLLFGSNLVVGGFNGFKFSIGEAFILTATILWAVENILAKKILNTVSTELVTFFRMGIGSAILLIASFITLPNALDTTLLLNQVQGFWIILSALLLFGYVLTWYSALKFTSAITVTSILVSATLITNVLSAIFVTHSWNVEITIQSLLIVAGTMIFVMSGKKTKKFIKTANR